MDDTDKNGQELRILSCFCYTLRSGIWSILVILGLIVMSTTFSVIKIGEEYQEQ